MIQRNWMIIKAYLSIQFDASGFFFLKRKKTIYQNTKRCSNRLKQMQNEMFFSLIINKFIFGP